MEGTKTSPSLNWLADENLGFTWEPSLLEGPKTTPPVINGFVDSCGVKKAKQKKQKPYPRHGQKWGSFRPRPSALPAWAKVHRRPASLSRRRWSSLLGCPSRWTSSGSRATRRRGQVQEVLRSTFSGAPTRFQVAQAS